MKGRPRTRETQQRRMVYEAIRQTHSHPTADTIFEQVREDMPKISLGTVYRNLSVLKDEGLVREIYGQDRRAHYEVSGEPHAHFVCTSCDRIWDVDGAPNVDWKQLKDLVGCEVVEQRIEFLGRCAACARAESQPT